MITVTAPNRCGLVGNPTDMYGGSAVSYSTRERARCTLDSGAEQITITVSGRHRTVQSLDHLV